MSLISQKYQKDFKNLDYKNPRLIRDKEKRQRKLWRVLIIVLSALIVGLGYFLFFSPVFTVKEISISGLNKIKRENIDKIIDDYRYGRDWYIFSHNNFWLFNKNDFKGEVFNRYYFEEFKISKRLPNKIVIQLKEKESAINWQTNNLCYNLDLSGLVTGYCGENNGYLTIKDLTNAEIQIGGGALLSEEMKYILELDRRLKNIVAGKYKILLIEKNDNLLDFVTEEGAMLKMNANLSINEQAARLDTLLNQVGIKENLLKMKYFDLRFGEKVYYK